MKRRWREYFPPIFFVVVYSVFFGLSLESAAYNRNEETSIRFLKEHMWIEREREVCESLSLSKKKASKQAITKKQDEQYTCNYHISIYNERVKREWARFFPTIYIFIILEDTFYYIIFFFFNNWNILF